MTRFTPEARLCAGVVKQFVHDIKPKRVRILKEGTDDEFYWGRTEYGKGRMEMEMDSEFLRLCVETVGISWSKFRTTMEEIRNGQRVVKLYNEEVVMNLWRGRD